MDGTGDHCAKHNKLIIQYMCCMFSFVCESYREIQKDIDMKKKRKRSGKMENKRLVWGEYVQSLLNVTLCIIHI